MSQPVNPESLPMQTTTPQLPPELQAHVEQYQDIRASFETARDEADRIDAEIEHQRKAAEGAENEATEAREEVAQLLRKPGTSAKEIQRLKAKERAAYTLAEDYRSVMAELEAAHEEAAEKAGIAKDKERRCYVALLSTHADELIKQACTTLEPLYRAIRMQQWAFAAQTGRGMAQWEHWTDSARNAALSVMDGHIQRGLQSFKFDVEGDPLFQAAQRPAGLGRFKEMTPATIHFRRVTKQLAAAQQQQSINN